MAPEQSADESSLLMGTKPRTTGGERSCHEKAAVASGGLHAPLRLNSNGTICWGGDVTASIPPVGVMQSAALPLAMVAGTTAPAKRHSGCVALP